MIIETVKDYWNAQPCNVKHSTAAINTKEYFEDVKNKRYFVEPHIIEFMELAKWDNKKVLEIGCGIGTDAYMLAKHGAIYTGVDLSDKSLEIAKKRFELFELNGSFLNINAENMEIYPNDTFDMIYSFGVIHHTVKPENIIKEVNRVLKKGGTFKLMLYATNSWKKIMIDSGLDQYEAQANTPIANTYTNDEVKILLKDFKDIKIEQTHIFPYKVEEYKKNVFIKEDWFSNMPETVFNSLKNKLGWHLCISCTK
jgi:ubiquinone/menaquinone biosynthesis C-methylase UbiE